MSHCGQRISPEANATWCGVVARARRLPFSDGALCLFSSWSRQIILPVFEQICADSSSQPSLPFRSFKPFGKYGGQVSNFPLIWFQCDGASWQLPTEVVPAHGVAMDTSLPWPEVLRPPANLKGTSSQAHLLAMSLNYIVFVASNFRRKLFHQQVVWFMPKRRFANTFVRLLLKGPLLHV